MAAYPGKTKIPRIVAGLDAVFCSARALSFPFPGWLWHLAAFCRLPGGQWARSLAPVLITQSSVSQPHKKGNRASSRAPLCGHFAMSSTRAKAMSRESRLGQNSDSPSGGDEFLFGVGDRECATSGPGRVGLIPGLVSHGPPSVVPRGILQRLRRTGLDLE